MAISYKLNDRCGGMCELCNAESATHEYTVTPKAGDTIDEQVALCDTCFSDLDAVANKSHWRCLEGSIWSAEAPVQALSLRLLQKINTESWANDVINSVDLDEDVVNWAMSAFEVADVHKDAFGNTLENGDNVLLTQALDVKGTSFSAPKGTVVKRIRLVPSNVEHIEGKINDQTIVILTKYVKKS